MSQDLFLIQSWVRSNDFVTTLLNNLYSCSASAFSFLFLFLKQCSRSFRQTLLTFKMYSQLESNWESCCRLCNQLYSREPTISRPCAEIHCNLNFGEYNLTARRGRGTKKHFKSVWFQCQISYMLQYLIFSLNVVYSRIITEHLQWFKIGD